MVETTVGAAPPGQPHDLGSVNRSSCAFRKPPTAVRGIARICGRILEQALIATSGPEIYAIATAPW